MNFLDLAAAAFKRGWPHRLPDVGNTIDYHTYIHSQDWEDRKTRYWATHEKQCVICFTAATLICTTSPTSIWGMRRMIT